MSLPGDLFSQRLRIRALPSELVYDAVPERARNGLYNLLTKYDERIPPDFYAVVIRQICYALDIRYEHDLYDELVLDDFETFVNGRLQAADGGWHEFFDVLEVIAGNLPQKLRDAFTNELNDVLRRNYVGYELRQGKFERVGARAEDAAIAEARGILKDPVFEGPNDQFLKSLAFYSQRPRPDLENCVKEAVGAVEGMARILLGNDSILLSDAANELVKRRKLPATLRKVFDGIYAYRGDAEGVGHGRTGAPEVAINDAEFVLNTSAAAIVYLARAYGIQVVT